MPLQRTALSLQLSAGSLYTMPVCDRQNITGNNERWGEAGAAAGARWEQGCCEPPGWQSGGGLGAWGTPKHKV